MLQDDPTLADEVTLMARTHFNKLASLAVRVQGARELGIVAAHSPIGNGMIPTEFVIEKMAAAWAHRRSIQQTQIDLEKLSSADLEKLGSAAYDELGEAHMEKLAAGVIDGSVAWDELTDMEKVAVGWMGSALKGLKKGWDVVAKGKTVKMPTAPKVPPASPAGKRKPWMKARTKLMIGGTAALGGGTYLGGKALDTGSAFLTPQPPGTAYRYGGGAPSHFMNPQMGM